MRPKWLSGLLWRGGGALAVGALFIFVSATLPSAPAKVVLTDSDGHSDLEEIAPAQNPVAAVAPVFASNDCRIQAGSGRVTVWNPDGPKRVGLQAGHWLTQEAPDDLARLRAQTGTSAGGYTEWQVNLDIAQRTVALLTDLGIEAEVLSTTLPPCYRSHVFLSIHGDGDVSGVLNGFKVARASASPIPQADDALVAALNEQYAFATGLPRDDNHISRRMLNYYAFNSRRSVHSIGPGVPSAIIETGFITNARDRLFLTRNADRVATGIANGILQFLGMAEHVPL